MHVVLWRYRVRDANRQDFERAYGPEGEWAALFGTAEGFLDTALLRDSEEPGVYATVDRWRSRIDLERFLAESGDHYRALDRRLERLTLEETRIGAFDG